MIRLRPSGVDELLIKRVRDWYEPGPGVFFTGITGTESFSPAMLFTTGVNGGWWDPSDTTTLFQDAAGTTPVTAVEQPVGLMLDKSGRGNHAFNASGNSANFPVLSARYNLLTKTEQFDDAGVWTKNNTTIGADTASTLAPNGTQTADYMYESASGSAIRAIYGPYPANVATSHTVSVYAKTNGVRYLHIRDDGSSVWTWVVFDLVSGVVSGNNGGANYVAGSAKIENAGNGWWKCSFSFNQIATGTRAIVFGMNSNPTPPATNSGLGTAYTGTGSQGIYIWGADLRVANDALNQPAYQRVNTASDYDTVGFKPYLKFNGVNQWLQTNSIDFTSTAQMFVSAGVRKLSDAAIGMLAELGTTEPAGSFYVSQPIDTAGNFRVSVRGSNVNQRNYGPNVAPTTKVLSASLTTTAVDSASAMLIRIDGTASSGSSFVSGSSTGNFGNYPLYIGARAGSSLWFNGRIYQLVVAGKQASASEITNTETYLNQKTGAY